jgi:hypothetical protein
MSTKKKTTTIPPWTRMDCSECGCDSEATRSEPKVITGNFVCSDCKLVEQATKGVEEDVYERVAKVSMPNKSRPPITTPAEAITISISEDTWTAVQHLKAAGHTDEKTIMLVALQSAVAIQLARLWAIVDDDRRDPASLAKWLMACHDDPNRGNGL